MLIDYPNQYFSEVVPPVIDGLTGLGIRLQMLSQEELDSHHVRFSLPSGAVSNDHFRMIVGEFVKTGVLETDAGTALHNVLLREEGKPPSSSPRLGK